jgi:hypothetical protein
MTMHCITHQSDPGGFSYIPSLIIYVQSTYCERASMPMLNSQCVPIRASMPIINVSPSELQCQCSMCPPQSFNANAQCVPFRASIPMLNVSPSEFQCQCSMCLPQSFNANVQYAAQMAYVTLINII